MATAASNWIADFILTYFFLTDDGSPGTRPTDIYLVFWAVTPSADGTGGTEVSTTLTGYARMLIHDNDGTPSYFQPNPPADDGDFLRIDNDTEILFTAVPGGGNAYQIAGVSLMDAAVSGNQLVLKKLDAPVDVDVGQAPRILVGDLIVRVPTAITS